MSITKLPVNYMDGVVKGTRKYRMTHNQDSTVSFVDVSEFIRPELTLKADDFNDTNDVINQLIDIEEDNAEIIDGLEDDVDDIVSGDTDVPYVRNATTADHATSAGTATSATHANSATTATYATRANSATSAVSVPIVANEFILANRVALSFTNKQCILTDERITVNSVANIYFADATSKANAKTADLTLTPRNGSLLITAVSNPSPITASIKVKVN